LDGETFAERLLREEKVAVVPATAFGKYVENNVRISYATSMNALSEAFDRMQTFLCKLKSKD
jgi:aspartate/methionine/tyrosine aminotransferase